MSEAKDGFFNPYYANIREHLTDKTKEDLLEELDQAFQTASENGSMVDPDFVEAYLAVLQEVHPLPRRTISETATEHFQEEFSELFSDQAQELPTVIPFPTTPHFDKAKSVGQEGYRRKASIHMLGILAAMVGVLLSIVIASNGDTLWNGMAAAGGDIFHIGPRENPAILELEEPGENGYRSLHEALSDYGITDVAPTWLPDGYIISSVLIEKSEDIVNLAAIYLCDNNNILIRVRIYPAELPNLNYEINQESLSLYETSKGKYYLMLNIDQKSVVWEKGNCYCSIMGNLSESQLKKIINSI